MMGFNFFNYCQWVVLFRVLCILNTSTVLAGPTNITVDDQDPSIRYTPSTAWQHITNGTTLDFEGAHMLTSNPNATASFNFTGIAIYFMSPLWPYTINTAISLDSGPSTLVNLTDHNLAANGGSADSETVRSQVVWHATGLADTQHNLLISVGASQPYALVDGLIYTTDTTVVSTSLSTSRVSPTSTPPRPAIASLTSTSIIASPSTGANATSLASSPKSNSQSVLAIIFGSLLGGLGLLIILCVPGLWYLFRRRKGATSQPQTIDEIPYIPPISINPSNSISSIRPNALNKNGNLTAHQSDNNRYYMPVTQSNNRQYLHYANSEIPPFPIQSNPYSYGGYQNSIGSHTVTTVHQPQMTSLIPNRNQPGSSHGLSESTTPENLMPQMANGSLPLEDPPAYRPPSTRI